MRGLGAWVAGLSGTDGHRCRRSAPDIPPCVTFDESLLEETELLEPGELQLNELTVESVQHTCVGALLGTEGGGRRCPCSAAASLPGLLGLAGRQPRGMALTLPFLRAQADLGDR